MNLHLVLFLSFLNIYRFSTGTRNKELIAMKTGLAEVSPCSVGMQFFAVLNNTADEDYLVELISDECCINSDTEMDCDSIQIIGESSDVIQKGNLKTFTLVAPVLDPFERNGYCVIHVDSSPLDKRSNIMRDTITINFDTKLENYVNLQSQTYKKCDEIDEDPFNDCKPVNCDVHYNGRKPIFDENTRKCIAGPKCRSKKSESSDVFDPNTNKCMVFNSIDAEDIDFIKSLSKLQVTQIGRFKSSNEGITVPAKDATPKSSSNKINKTEVRKKFCDNSILQYLVSNRYTLIVLAIVISAQCCLIFTMIYCLTQRSIQCEKKKVDRKYFNYRQDVSVTTPLIPTSNMDTETAFDYISESSNIEKKIKCYKSCQKERKNDTKISMSDDILTKCLNRRDWNAKPKSDITKDANNPYYDSFTVDWKAFQANLKESPTVETIQKEEKGIETEMTIQENQKPARKQYKEDYTDSDSSEKFIKCHDYNFTQSMIRKDEMKAPSMSTDTKGAQACFSNDSIDDFLSERGMAFLAGERLSKYSFSSISTSNPTDDSSKTSKNRNILKNVLSYLSNKSKKYTSSDPGKKPSGKDLELIHMSQATMYSSSASEYKNVQGVKCAKDSRSTF